MRLRNNAVFIKKLIYLVPLQRKMLLIPWLDMVTSKLKIGEVKIGNKDNSIQVSIMDLIYLTTYKNGMKNRNHQYSTFWTIPTLTHTLYKLST
jgi:hypothetical protein